MKREEAIKELEALQLRQLELNKIIETPEKTAVERFLELTNNLIRKFDFEKEEKNIYFLNEKEEVIFNEDYKSGYLYCEHSLYWSFFEKEYGMNYDQIQAFTASLMEEHFNCKGLTPAAVYT